MSTAIETVNAFMEALELKDYERAASNLADGMFFSGFTPKPLPKEQFIAVMSGLTEGIPNLSYMFHNAKEVDNTSEGARVTGTVHITGTQTDSFELPPLGIGPVPQTAQSISLPEETWEYLVREGMIASIRVDLVPGGDIEGLLNHLGIDYPIVQ